MVNCVVARNLLSQSVNYWATASEMAVCVQSQWLPAGNRRLVESSVAAQCVSSTTKNHKKKGAAVTFKGTSLELNIQFHPATMYM